MFYHSDKRHHGGNTIMDLNTGSDCCNNFRVCPALLKPIVLGTAPIPVCENVSFFIFFYFKYLFYKGCKEIQEVQTDVAVLKLNCLILFLNITGK